MSLATALFFLPALAAADVKSATKRAKAGKLDATTEVQCAQEVGEALKPCGAAVARHGDAAAVVVTFPNEFKRTLMFESGAFLRGNTTMSGVGTDNEWTLTDGTYRIRVDDQQFEMPEAFVTGPD
ncbi:MAG: hypothetical protein AAGK71_06090 [Pseudomonadota bacterium]